MSQDQRYSIQSFPASRQFTMDIGQLGLKKHYARALIEVDVTEVRSNLRRMKESGFAGVSFTAWMLKCIARALKEYPEIHAIRLGLNRRVLFEDVDISVMVEREVEGQQVPLPVVIRRANEKDATAIHEELRSAKHQAIGNGSSFVLGTQNEPLYVRSVALLPQWIRLLGWKWLLRDPFRVKKMMGTVMVSSVGMGGAVRGWAVPVSIHPVSITLGSITKKPGAFQNEVTLREFLPVTILIDHDVVDGMSMARFVSHLTKLIETDFDLPVR